MIKRPLTEIKLEIDDVEKFKSFLSDYEQKDSCKLMKSHSLLDTSMDNRCNDDAAFSPLGSALFNKDLIRGAHVSQLIGPSASEGSSRRFLDFTFDARGMTSGVPNFNQKCDGV